MIFSCSLWFILLVFRSQSLEPDNICLKTTNLDRRNPMIRAKQAAFHWQILFCQSRFLFPNEYQWFVSCSFHFPSDLFHRWHVLRYDLPPPHPILRIRRCPALQHFTDLSHHDQGEETVWDLSICHALLRHLLLDIRMDRDSHSAGNWNCQLLVFQRSFR